MTGMTALIYFAAWTLILVFVSVNWRVVEVLRGKKADLWTRDQSAPRPAIVVRMEHAHLNCLENLPIFGAIVLVAFALGKSAVVDQFAAWIIYARLAQSVTHLIGVNHFLVLLRATFYTIQVLLFFYMMWMLTCGAS
jgi:uncharacterized MAPEG superfamily protein